MKITMVAHGPGSANALYPLIKKLKRRHKVKLVALHRYVADLWGCEITPEEDYLSCIDDCDLVIYGTGSSNLLESIVPVVCDSRGIVSICILDVFWASVENLCMRFKYYSPTYIITPTEDQKELIVDAGILHESRVRVLGNPHFDRLKSFTSTNVGINKVSFVSQCSTNGDKSDTSEECKKALLELINYRNTKHQSLQIKVCSHPRENKEWLIGMCQLHNMEMSSKDSFEVSMESDVVIGVGSTILYEAMLVGKRVCFYDGSNLESAFTDAHGIKHLWRFDATSRCVEFINSIEKGKIIIDNHIYK